MTASSNTIETVADIVTTYEKCIQALIILSEARNCGQDISGIRFMFELEKHKLYLWASEVGLFDATPSLRFGANHAHLVPNILKYLYRMLSDLHTIRQNYGLQLLETDVEISALDQYGRAFDRLQITEDDGFHLMQSKIFEHRSSPWKCLSWEVFDEDKARKLIEDVRGYVNELQSILDRARQSRFQAAIDAVLRNAILNTANEQDLDVIGTDLDVSEYCDSCSASSRPQSSGNTYSQITVSGNAQVVFGNIFESEADFVRQPGGSQRAIAAAARLKKQGLLLGVMDVEQTVSERSARQQDQADPGKSYLLSSKTLIPRWSKSNVTAMRLSSRRFKIYIPQARPVRLFAYYDSTPVLLEFRGDTRLDPNTDKIRLCRVAAFLSHLDAAFHGLSCRGYVKVHRLGYAYVFDIPSRPLRHSASHSSSLQINNVSNPPLPSLKTLRDLFRIPMPTMNARLSLAIVLLETLLQIHTAGWLHKELRSENIVFIYESASDDICANTLPSCYPYIAGYVHSRADDPGEATDPLEADLEADLYRHPFSIGGYRRSYCKAFDMFSAGCILLELGMWCSLSSIFRKGQCIDPENGHADRDLVRSRHEMLLSPLELIEDSADLVSKVTNTDSGGVLSELASRMGVRYTLLVVSLLKAWDTFESSDASAEMSQADVNKSLLKLETECLETVQAMATVL